tara:strand:- start:3467 stop:3757 length:291 start_codon:yes stop_codon:yes gene_type:complete
MSTSDFEFDFGFTTMDEDELDRVQDLSAAVEHSRDAKQTLQTQVETVETKLNNLYNMFQPLLNNLQANREKPYIYWPDRYEKVEQFRDKVDEVFNA